MKTNMKMMTCLLGLAMAVSQSALAHDHSHHHDQGAQADLDQNRPAALSGSSAFQLDSKWINQDGKEITLKSFQGKTLVLAMAYTSCKSACPILVSDMQRIEHALPAELKGKVSFALFSFDSKNDTPKTLTNYAQTRGLDLKNWTLLKSDKDAVRELAAVLGVRYKQDENGDFSHSNVITVLNSSGEIVHQQVGLRAEPKETVEVILNENHKRDTR